MIEVNLDSSVDSQEILDMMLTLVESTLQKTNSGANCLSKTVNMKELICIVKILSYAQLTKFENDVLVNLISQKLEKSNCLYALYESFLKLQETNMNEHCQYWFPLFNNMIDY